MNDKLDELHYIYKMIGNYGFCTVQELLDKYNELQQENKQLKLDNQKLDSCLTEYTSLYREEQSKNIKAQENLENPYNVDCEQQCKDVLTLLRGEDNE